VQVTYTGRYRVGGGDWTPIPDTLTVDGDPVNLAIIEGQPNLIAPP
jgi:inorganic pyrophosphatase